MNKVFIAAEKLFFYILIVCLVSFIYFNMIPLNEYTFKIGIIFSFVYFYINFYIGYKYNHNVINNIKIGTIGNSMQLFLAFFALNSYMRFNMPYLATWIITPYFISTLSIAKLLSIEINIWYSFALFIINIMLVIIGSTSRNIMNKLSR